jgi:hypothetical protein
LHLTYVIKVQSSRVLVVLDCEVYGEDGSDARHALNPRRLKSHVDLKLNENPQSVAVHFQGPFFRT